MSICAFDVIIIEVRHVIVLKNSSCDLQWTVWLRICNLRASIRSIAIVNTGLVVSVDSIGRCLIWSSHRARRCYLLNRFLGGLFQSISNKFVEMIWWQRRVLVARTAVNGGWGRWVLRFISGGNIAVWTAVWCGSVFGAVNSRGVLGALLAKSLFVLAIRLNVS